MNFKFSDLANCTDEDDMSRVLKPRKVNRSYQFCKSMMYAIQAITGHKTHEIVSNLVSIADKIIESHEVDPSDPHKKGFKSYYGKEIKDYIYYPETKVYTGVYLKITADDAESYWGLKSGKKENSVSYSFKAPQSYIKLNDTEFDDLAADGMLMDYSLDIDEPNLRKTKTPAEKKAEADKKAAIAKAKREHKKALKEAAKAKKLP